MIDSNNIREIDVFPSMDEHNILIEAHRNHTLRDQALAQGLRYMRELTRGNLLSQQIVVYAAVDDEGAEWRVVSVGTDYAMWEEEDHDGFDGLLSAARLPVTWNPEENPSCTVYSLYDE